jgi:hypothetical protein
MNNEERKSVLELEQTYLGGKIAGTIYMDVCINPDELVPFEKLTDNEKRETIAICIANHIPFDVSNDYCLELHCMSDCDIANYESPRATVIKESNDTNRFEYDGILNISIGILHLPIIMFKDKKEGDTVEYEYKINYNNILFINTHMNLRLNQLDSQFDSYGDFEVILKEKHHEEILLHMNQRKELLKQKGVTNEK